jgi:hypothetical protein
MTRSVIAVVALLVLVSGCLVGQRSSAPDADTDGLPDELETAGWNLTINSTVRDCFADTAPVPDVEERFVKSNELRTDSDADGVDDFDEHFFHGDPSVNDTDGDGLTDGTEWEVRADTTLFAGGRLALNTADSDDDCLTDGEEVVGFLIPNIGMRTSDPTTSDSDHDGLIDAAEFRQTKTDPNVADTDGDGSIDGSDLDPLHDVRMRITFQTLGAKDLSSNEARVKLYWTVPAKDPSESNGETDAFMIKEGETLMLTSEQSPGEIDVDDQRGGTYVFLEVYARIVDDGGAVVGVLDINPHSPGQAVSVRYDVATDEWAFSTPNGYTPSGRQRSVETSQARLTFNLEDFVAP